MTAVPSGGAPVWAIPADDVADEQVDMLSLAGQPVPDSGAWLWVTAAESQPGGELTGLFLAGNRPLADGGDVLVHVRPAGQPDAAAAAARVQVWAVAGGSLVRVAGWDAAGLDAWPEIVRDPAAFAMAALTELEQHGADICAPGRVEVIPAAQAGSAGFPVLPVRVNAAG